MNAKANYAGFLQLLQEYYEQHGRHDLPWRQAEPDGSFDPYKILVSEIMLQQTQVPRVRAKYHEFLAAFPTVESLAAAELGQVLRVWSGLGYNRRAKYLHQAAKEISALGYFPKDIAKLVKLSGVGKNTAGAILAYAFNKQALFIETNIRTVYIHHFFSGKSGVTDSEIVLVLERTMDRENPRRFYWSLMDYGSHLKKEVGNLNKVSKHYSKQSTFEGSRRQIRGEILRQLNTSPRTVSQLRRAIPDTRLQDVLRELVAEGLIQEADHTFHL